LVNIDKYACPETYDICANSLNFILKEFLASEKCKSFLLSGNKGTEMYLLREEIVEFFSEYIDNDILSLLSSYLEVKEDKIEEEHEEVLVQEIFLRDYDPDDIDSIL
jgi:hypothetical protein